MARETRRKEHLSEEEIRQRVNRVMDNWQSYPDFAHLFDALLVANDNTAPTEFARLLNTYPVGQSFSAATIQVIREGRSEPSYGFVVKLLDSNLLHLDPATTKTDDDEPAAPQRVALFTAAGLIEVTDASVRIWTREVLAAHARRTAEGTNPTNPSWKHLMLKLIQFQTQGGRTTINGLAEQARSLAGDSTLFEKNRLQALLGAAQCVPTEKERHALYQLLALDADQVRYVEKGIDTGVIPLQPPTRRTDFTEALNNVLDHLKTGGVSQAQLVQQSYDSRLNVCLLSATTLSRWKRGGSRPTLEGLRGLSYGLSRCQDKSGQCLVPEEDLTRLIAAAGYSQHELTDTSHDIIAGINEHTTIKPLLAALRYAADISTAVPAIPTVPGKLSHSNIIAWEQSGKRFDYPTGEQVQELLRQFNQVIASRGLPLLVPEEIGKVVAVAERDRSRWEQTPLHERVGARKPERPRLPPSACFDDGLTR